MSDWASDMDRYQDQEAIAKGEPLPDFPPEPSPARSEAMAAAIAELEKEKHPTITHTHGGYTHTHRLGQREDAPLGTAGIDVAGLAKAYTGLHPEAAEEKVASMLGSYLPGTTADRAANDVMARLGLGGYRIVPKALLAPFAAYVREAKS